jgi:hypothetical protein
MTTQNHFKNLCREQMKLWFQCFLLEVVHAFDHLFRRGAAPCSMNVYPDLHMNIMQIVRTRVNFNLNESDRRIFWRTTLFEPMNWTTYQETNSQLNSNFICSVCMRGCIYVNTIVNTNMKIGSTSQLCMCSVHVNHERARSLLLLLSLLSLLSLLLAQVVIVIVIVLVLVHIRYCVMFHNEMNNINQIVYEIQTITQII